MKKCIICKQNIEWFFGGFTSDNKNIDLYYKCCSSKCSKKAKSPLFKALTNEYDKKIDSITKINLILEDK